MPRYAEKDLTKVTVNIYTDTYNYFKRRYGEGWSVKLREVLDAHVETDRFDARYGGQR